MQFSLNNKWARAAIPALLTTIVPLLQLPQLLYLVLSLITLALLLLLLRKRCITLIPSNVVNDPKMNTTNINSTIMT